MRRYLCARTRGRGRANAARDDARRDRMGRLRRRGLDADVPRGRSRRRDGARGRARGARASAMGEEICGKRGGAREGRRADGGTREEGGGTRAWGRAGDIARARRAGRGPEGAGVARRRACAVVDGRWARSRARRAARAAMARRTRRRETDEGATRTGWLASQKRSSRNSDGETRVRCR